MGLEGGLHELFSLSNEKNRMEIDIDLFYVRIQLLSLNNTLYNFLIFIGF